MFRITSSTYQGYDIVASIAVEYDEWEDSLTGRLLKDEVVLYTSYNPRGKLINGLTDTVHFSMESLDKIIEIIENGEESEITNSEGETVLNLNKLEEESPNFKSNIKDMRKTIKSIDYSQTSVENTLVFDADTSEEMIPNLPIPKNKSFGELIIFGGIPIIKNEIDSDFDFMDYTKAHKASGSYKCDYCRKRRKREDGYITERRNQVCSKCAKKIRKKCAKIGGNQELINKIVADTI